MSIVMQKEIDKIKKEILSQGAAVEHQLHLAVSSLIDRNSDLARKVIEGDLEIDKLDVDLEEECLKILALHQPVAIDLRYIISILKMNSDLERIGDLAVNIAERSAFLAQNPPVKTHFDFHAMSEKVKSMLRKSLDALVRMDVRIACEVIKLEDETDEMNRVMYALATEDLNKHLSDPACIIQVTSVSRHLERIADQCTNIASDVIYMVEGKIIRHNKSTYKPNFGPKH